MKLMNMVSILVLIFTLSGCQTEVYDKIPLIIYNIEDPYIKNFNDQILEDAEDLFEVISFDSKNSQIIQNEIIVEQLKKRPKAIIVNPVDRLGAYTIIEKAKEYDVPVVFFNREPLEEDLNSWSLSFYVGALDEQSVVIQANIIKNLFGNPENLSSLDLNGDNNIQTVILKGEQGHQAAEIRTVHVISELEDAGYHLDLLAIEVCNWNTDEAYNFMLDYIPTSLEQVELVISNNDAMAIGAIDALIELEVFKDINEDGYYDNVDGAWIPVVGVDALSEAIPYLENGTLAGTVLNDSSTQSKAIVELVEALIHGRDPSTISFDIDNESFIWIEYKRFELEED
jgi:methyl-galactoside transport system substrate-binding protein